MQKNQNLQSSLKNKIRYFDKKYLFSSILKLYNFYRKFNKRKFKIKPVSNKYGFYINDYLKKDNLLTQLCEKYNSDKGGNKNPFLKLVIIIQIIILKFLRISDLSIKKFLNVALVLIIHF